MSRHIYRINDGKSVKYSSTASGVDKLIAKGFIADTVEVVGSEPECNELSDALEKCHELLRDLAKEVVVKTAREDSTAFKAAASYLSKVYGYPPRGKSSFDISEDLPRTFYERKI